MNIIRIKKGNINRNILFITLAIYMFFSNIANYTIYSDISILLLIAVSIIYILNNKKIYLNIYFYLYIIFVGYQLFLTISGVAINTSVTLSQVKTMLINFTILVCIYNIMMCTKDIKGFMKIYVVVSAVSLATIMFLLRDSLFAGRLAHAYGEGSVSYYFLGVPVGMTSNGLAFFCAISAMLCIYFFSKEKSKLYLILSLFFILGVVLTGSRKGILILALCMLFIINLIYKNNIGLKIIIVLVSIGSIWLLITKVPALYNIIGKRLIELIKHFIGQSTTEGSIIVREQVKHYALQWINNKPWMGYGAGSFKAVYGNVTESNYLEMMVAGGIIGTILYYLYTIPVINKFIKTKAKDDILKILFFIVMSLLVIDYGSATYLSRTYLIYIVIYLAYVNILKKNKESDDNIGRNNK